LVPVCAGSLPGVARRLDPGDFNAARWLCGPALAGLIAYLMAISRPQKRSSRKSRWLRSPVVEANRHVCITKSIR
jgi:hypothetical protein